MEGLKMKFEAVLKGVSLGIFEVPLPGLHSVCNSLAAIAVADELQLDINNVRDAVRNFSGVQRRFEFKGETGGIKVFDDYGHHPTEIIATLKAAREAMIQNTEHRAQTKELPTLNSKPGRLIVLFQPHRYTRTRDLMIDFYGAFKDANIVILMDIYPAGEEPLNGITSEVLFKGIKATGKDIKYLKDRDEIIDYLAKNLKAQDVLFTLGAGDVWKIGEEFLKFKNVNYA